MAVTAVRWRAAAALGLAGLLVLPALLVMSPVAAAVASVLVAIAVTLPGPVAAGAARSAARPQG